MVSMLRIILGLTAVLGTDAHACSFDYRGYFDTVNPVPQYGPSCSVSFQGRIDSHVFSVPRVVGEAAIALDFVVPHPCVPVKGAFYLDCASGRSFTVSDGESLMNFDPAMPTVADVLAEVESDAVGFDQLLERAHALRFPEAPGMSLQQRLALLASPVRYPDVEEGSDWLADEGILPDQLRASCGCQMLFPGSQQAAEFATLGPPPVLAAPTFVEITRIEPSVSVERSESLQKLITPGGF